MGKLKHTIKTIDIKPNALTRKLKPSFKNIAAHDRLKRIQLGLPVPRTSATHIPWGYIDIGGYLLIPDVTALRLLCKARKYLKKCSLQEISNWITAETGMYLSGEGFRLILTQRFPYPEIELSDDERERIYRNPTNFSSKTIEVEESEQEGQVD